MPPISEKEKMALAALSASVSSGPSGRSAPKKKKKPFPFPLPKPRPEVRKKPTLEDIKKGIISPGDGNDSVMMKKKGGMVKKTATKKLSKKMRSC